MVEALTIEDKHHEVHWYDERRWLGAARTGATLGRSSRSFHVMGSGDGLTVSRPQPAGSR
jgi:hypothetical protein